MNENITLFLSKRTTKIFLIISLSFFTYMLINIVLSYGTTFILNGNIKEKISIYSQATLCNRSYNMATIVVFIHRFIYKVGIFIIIKALLFNMIIRIKEFSNITDLYIKPVLNTVIMTDFLYVILTLLIPSYIDWNAYFNTSYLIGNGLFLFIPSWIFLGISCILNFKIVNKRFENFKMTLVYLLFAFLSFLFQLSIVYLLFGKIFYKI